MTPADLEQRIRAALKVSVRVAVNAHLHDDIVKAVLPMLREAMNEATELKRHLGIMLAENMPTYRDSLGDFECLFCDAVAAETEEIAHRPNCEYAAAKVAIPTERREGE